MAARPGMTADESRTARRTSAARAAQGPLLTNQPAQAQAGSPGALPRDPALRGRLRGGRSCAERGKATFATPCTPRRLPAGSGAVPHAPKPPAPGEAVPHASPNPAWLALPALGREGRPLSTLSPGPRRARCGPRSAPAASVRLRLVDAHPGRSAGMRETAAVSRGTICLCRERYPCGGGDRSPCALPATRTGPPPLERGEGEGVINTLRLLRDDLLRRTVGLRACRQPTRERSIHARRDTPSRHHRPRLAAHAAAGRHPLLRLPLQRGRTQPSRPRRGRAWSSSSRTAPATASRSSPTARPR